jgi:glycosyltransferase involved in cell wall biosynthesis
VQGPDNVRHIQVSGGGLFGWPGALTKLRAKPWLVHGALQFVWAAQKALRDLEPLDLLIAHFIVPCAWPASLGTKAPLEIVVHGSDGRLLLSLPRVLRRRILSDLAQRAVAIRLSSRELMLAFEKELPHQRHLLRVEPPALSLDAALPRAEARKRLGLGTERIALVVARLVVEKRLEVALSASSLLPDTKVVVVGSGPERAQLQRRFGDVSFLGQLPHAQTLTWLAAADVLLSASRHEGAPTAIREARALGVPVVACPAGDLALWAKSDPELYVTRAF